MLWFFKWLVIVGSRCRKIIYNLCHQSIYIIHLYFNVMIFLIINYYRFKMYKDYIQFIPNRYILHICNRLLWFFLWLIIVGSRFKIYKGYIQHMPSSRTISLLVCPYSKFHIFDVFLFTYNIFFTNNPSWI